MNWMTGFSPADLEARERQDFIDRAAIAVLHKFTDYRFDNAAIEAMDHAEALWAERERRRQEKP